MKLAILFLTFLVYCNLPAQDYFAYQETFNRVDEDLFAGNLPLAMERLDSIEGSYAFIYGHHCVKGLQICCKATDSLRAEKWLIRAFKQGIPVWMIRNDGLMNKTFGFQNTIPVIRSYDSLHAVYEESYNHQLRARLDSLIERDQFYTHKVNEVFIPLRLGVFFRWKRANVRHAHCIKAITEQDGFPGERLIGFPLTVVDSAMNFKFTNARGANPNETSAYIMLIHYYSSPRNDMNGLLLKSIAIGDLPPDFYGAWNDFMALHGKKKYRESFYNVWHKDLHAEHLPAIDERRKAVGLNSFEQQERNEAVSKVRSKEGKINSEILLE